MLWKSCGPKKDELPGDDVMRVSMICTAHQTEAGRHVACVGEKRNSCRIFVGKSEGQRPVQDLGVDGRIILKSVLKNII